MARSQHVWYNDGLIPHKHTIWLSGGSLLIILMIGAALRFGLAPSASNSDVFAMRNWMESSAVLGLVPSYERQLHTSWLPTYPPVSIMALQASGLAYRAIYGHPYSTMDPDRLLFVKAPAIVADLLACVLLFTLFATRKRRGTGLIAAGVYALHPAVIYTSAIWGQVDAIYTLFLLATMVAATRHRYAIAGMSCALAVLSKPQTLMFLPLILFVVSWKPRDLLRALAGGILTTVAVLSPFAAAGKLGLVLQTYDLLHVMSVSRISWHAYNFWWLLLSKHAWDVQGSIALIWVVTYRHLSMVLCAIVYATILAAYRSARRILDPEQREYLGFLAAGLVALGMFTFGTEMHERYLFPFIALALPWACRGWRNAAFYGCVSLLFTMNLAIAFPYGALAASLVTVMPELPVMIGGIHVVMCVLLLERLIRDVSHVHPSSVRGQSGMPTGAALPSSAGAL